MEEGYIAKIIHGDGAKDIKVGEVCPTLVLLFFLKCIMLLV